MKAIEDETVEIGARALYEAASGRQYSDKLPPWDELFPDEKDHWRACFRQSLAALAREGRVVQSADEVDARIEAAVAAERERCARIVKGFVGCEAIATAIREQNHDE